MFEGLKKIGAIAAGRTPRDPSLELQQLLAAAREERVALTALLDQLGMRGEEVTQLGKTFEAVARKANTATGKLDELKSQLARIEGSTKAVDEIDKRVATIAESADAARRTAEGILAPDGELRQQREVMRALTAEAAKVESMLEAIRKEREALEEARNGARQVQAEVRTSLEALSASRSEVEQLRGAVTVLNQEYGRIRDTAREAHEHASTATEAARDIEKRIATLSTLQELSTGTEDRLASLNALAEHVGLKVKSLESQKHTVERAIVESNRLNEMVWAMDVQIAKLNEGGQQGARTEELLARLEKLAQESASQFEAGTRARDEFAREIARIEKDSAGLVEFGRTHIEQLTVRRKEVEAFEERLRAAQQVLAQSEARVEAVATKDKAMLLLGQRADVLAKKFDEMTVQADDLAKKQATLDSLSARLSQVDEMSKRVGWQFDSIRQSRQDVEVLRKEIQDVYKSFADVTQLRDRVGNDRAALEAFGERMNAFLLRVPELEAKIDGLVVRVAVVDEGLRRAAKLDELNVELERQIARVSGRVPLVDKLDSRLNALNALSAEIDTRLKEQIERGAELEGLKSQLDGVRIQATDAGQKLQAVLAAQATLAGLAEQVPAVRADIDGVNARIEKAKLDTATIAEQEKRVEGLLTGSRALSLDTGERLRQLQGLLEELKRSSSVKDELIAELSRVQGRQREITMHVEAADDQTRRLETILSQLEQRRSQFAFAEKKIGGFEARLAALKDAADEIDGKMRDLTGREAEIQAVRGEVDAIREISAGVKADLEYVTSHRGDVTRLRSRVDDLLGRIGQTDERLAAVAAQRRAVDEIHAKTNMIVNMLDDVRLNVETLGEQRAIVDDLAQKLAGLEFSVQEAQNTAKTLQRERELAERIEQSIRQVRARTAAEEGKRTA
jgi:chromosome segregation ATPase